jgi:hypothetical protein
MPSGIRIPGGRGTSGISRGEGWGVPCHNRIRRIRAGIRRRVMGWMRRPSMEDGGAPIRGVISWRDPRRTARGGGDGRQVRLLGGMRRPVGF